MPSKDGAVTQYARVDGNLMITAIGTRKELASKDGILVRLAFTDEKIGQRIYINYISGDQLNEQGFVQVPGPSHDTVGT